MSRHSAHLEFESELEGERLRVLRLRFLWMCGTYLAVSCLILPIKFLAVPGDGSMRAHQLLKAWWGAGWFLGYVAAVLFAVFAARQRRTIFLLAMGMTMLAVVSGTPEARWEAQLEGTFHMGRLVEETQRNMRSGSTTRPTTRGIREALRAAREAEVAATQPAVVAETSSATTRLGPNVAIVAGPGNQGDTANPVLSAMARLGDLTPARKAAISGVTAVFWAHLVACVFMPWTLRESATVAGAGVASYAGVVGVDAAAGNLEPALAVVGLALTAMSTLPGMGLCWWRHSAFRQEFRLRFESGRYRELRGELESARRIHESCLPAPLLSGPARVAYAYRPMRDIGGDLMFRRQFGAAHLVVLVDVTGHGIAAALTVNRLLGELERVVGEANDPTPGELLASLNAYACLMLAEHGLYMSALVFRAVEGGEVTYASGGHPTAYVVSKEGETRELYSTAPLLGILAPGEYAAREEAVALGEGEAIVACTDGATETTQRDGTMLRTAGMRALVEEVARRAETGAETWPEMIMRRLDGLRAGEIEDDTLVVTICVEPPV